MTPSVVAEQLEQGLRDFLCSSFDATTGGDLEADYGVAWVHVDGRFGDPQ